MRRAAHRGRALRAVAWALAALAGTVALVAVAVPLVVRGPVLARLVEHQSKRLCGSLTLEGGRVGLDVVPALILQRPFRVMLDGLRIREPSGPDFFRASTVRARVAVLRHPWRVVMDDALIADGRWRLVDKGLGQPIMEALQTVPPGGRAECGLPAVIKVPGAAPSPGPKFSARSVSLERVSIMLSFPSWGVALEDVDARGTVDVRITPRGMQFLFDARDVTTSKGGTLRVGGRSSPLAPEVPFDRVVIPRVAVTAGEPRNLLLEVKEARTGRAVLSGHSVFTNVFVPSPRRVPAGMNLEARWTGVGQVLRRTSAWAALGEPLAKLHAGLRTALHGPFETLTGFATVAGTGASAHARLLPHRRYTVDVQFDGLDTAPLVTPAQRALLGGRLDGRLSASARIGRPAASTALSLDTIELALTREHAAATDQLPRRWVVSRAFRRRAPNELRVSLGTAALEAGTLRVEPLRVALPGVLWAGGVRGARESGSSAFLVRASAQSGSQVSWRGETFLSPPLVVAHVDPGRGVSIDPLSVRHVGGGVIEAGGSLSFDPHGPLALWTAIRGYPLARLPGVGLTRAPGQRGTVATVLHGQLDASFGVGGSAQKPSLAGTLALTDVRWARHRLGNGRVVFEGIPDGTRFAGPILDGVDVRGSLRRRPGADDFVAVTLRDLPLGPWLPGAAAALPLRAAGEVVWRPGEGGARARTTADIALRGPGIDAHASGELGPDQDAASPIAGAFRARVDGAALGPWLPGKGSGRGTAALDGKVAGTLGAPRVQAMLRFQSLAFAWPDSPFGPISLDGLLAIDDRTATVGPLLARFGSGGWLRVAGRNGHGSGRVVLATRAMPLPISEVDLTVNAAGVKTSRPIAWLSLSGVGLSARVTEDRTSTLRVVGTVQLGHDLVEMAKRGKSEEGAPHPQGARSPSLADHVWVHLQLTGPPDGVTVDVPKVPDVILGAHCTIEGPLSSPRIFGEVKGDNLYSRVALAVADWFNPRNLRKCDLGPRPQSP